MSLSEFRSFLLILFIFVNFSPFLHAQKTTTVADDNNPFSSNHFNAILCQDDLIWLASMNGIISIPKDEGNALGNEINTYLEGLQIFDIAADEKGTLWAIGSENVFRFENNMWIEVDVPHNFILLTTIAFSPKGALWMGGWVEVAFEGVLRWQNGTSTDFSSNPNLISDEIEGIVFSGNDSVIVCTQSGLNVYDGKDWEILPKPKYFNNYILSGIAQNAEHGFAISTQFHGIFYMNGSNISYEPNLGSLAISEISDITGFDSDLWIRNAKEIFRRKNNMWEKVNIPIKEDQFIWNFTVADENLFLATNEGVLIQSLE